MHIKHLTTMIPITPRLRAPFHPKDTVFAPYHPPPLHTPPLHTPPQPIKPVLRCITCPSSSSPSPSPQSPTHATPSLHLHHHPFILTYPSLPNTRTLKTLTRNRHSPSPFPLPPTQHPHTNQSHRPQKPHTHITTSPPARTPIPTSKLFTKEKKKAPPVPMPV